MKSKEKDRTGEKWNRITPFIRETEIVGLSPIDLYEAISGESPYSFLLESLEGEEKTARYSILGYDPVFRFESRGEECLIIKGEFKERVEGDPVGHLERLMDGMDYECPSRRLRYSGGCVGYFGYDVVRFMEKLPDSNPDDLKIPEAHFLIPGTFIVFDHKRQTLTMMHNSVTAEDGKSPALLDRLEQTIEQIRRGNGTGADIQEIVRESGSLRSNLSRDEFETMVERSREYILAGDIFQVVLSQRFQTRLECAPLDVYRTLRRTNPSPYMYYLNFNDVQVIGSSPEILVRVEDGCVETRPLAGTRPRGKSDKEDRLLIEDLKGDDKEKAEHIMLVDLGRNDIGRVCEHGTVKVDELMGIEKYSHVMHLVSNVTGRLSKGKNAFDVLRACFPAGTVSGAPKIRAMEIIDELEPIRRGIYAGAVGYIGFDGNLDTCIAIRTIVVKDGTAYIQAGAGIVADSIPEREYQETVNKARAMVKAIEIAAGRH